jgi:hypothetical protein
MERLVVLNLDTARYDCIYGRGCDGICCQRGRPPVYPEETPAIDAHLHRFLPLLRPEAQAVIRRVGYLTRPGVRQPRLRRAAGWCVFFHNGCVLHRVGAAEGDKFKYKPALCSLFPLKKDRRGRWYVRQKGYKGEIWDLFCLDPAQPSKPAAESLREELTLAESYHEAAGEGFDSSDRDSWHLASS